MEMVPIPGARDRQRRRLSRAIRHNEPAVSDPFLTSGAQHRQRARPTFGDSYNAPLTVNSSYQPPEPTGINNSTLYQQIDPFEDFLLFHSPPSPRSRRMNGRPRRRLNRDNPAVDMGGICSHGCCCMQCVRTQEVGIVEDFGKFREIVPPGLYCFQWPLSSIAGRLSLRIQQLDVVCETKTKDNVFVHVQVSVQYRVLVEKSYDAYYRLNDPSIQIKSYAFDVIRSTVPKMTVDEAFVSKSDIADTIMERLFEMMRDYGYEIISALITDLTPDEKVKSSMNEIEASKRLKEAIPHRAEAEKIKVVKKAEAAAEAMYLSGIGTANARIALAKGMKESMSGLKKDYNVTPQEVMHLLLVNQYLDTLSSVKPDEVIARATPNEVFELKESLPK